MMHFSLHHHATYFLKAVFLFTLITSLSACSHFLQPPAPEPLPKPPKKCICETKPVKNKVISKKVPKKKNSKTKKIKKITPVYNLALFGEVEYVNIAGKVREKARIDTGAETTSMDATNIKPFERDNESWISFDINARNNLEKVTFKRKVQRVAIIKRHGAEPIKRYVVHFTLGIGDLFENIEVTLTDRSNFRYSVLIGRNFLDNRAVVDVSKRFIMVDPKENSQGI